MTICGLCANLWMVVSLLPPEREKAQCVVITQRAFFRASFGVNQAGIGLRPYPDKITPERASSRDFRGIQLVSSARRQGRSGASRSSHLPRIGEGRHDLRAVKIMSKGWEGHPRKNGDHLISQGGRGMLSAAPLGYANVSGL